MRAAPCPATPQPQGRAPALRGMHAALRGLLHVLNAVLHGLLRGLRAALHGLHAVLHVLRDGPRLLQLLLQALAGVPELGHSAQERFHLRTRAPTALYASHALACRVFLPRKPTPQSYPNSMPLSGMPPRPCLMPGARPAAP